MKFLCFFSIMGLDPEVWGPPYWFFLHTIALNYPKHPNASTKKKYYDLIQNFDLFIPVESHAKNFMKLLSLYPVSPYLDNRHSFVRWMHFIHNKINEQLEKPKISLAKFYTCYYDQFKSKTERNTDTYQLREKMIYGGELLLIVGIIYYLYNK